MKRKQKRKHLESTDFQETVKASRKKLKVTYAVQCEHKEMATTLGITNSCKDTSQSGSPLKTINSACEEKEFSDLTKEIPEPGPSGLFQDNRQMAEKDPNSEYHSCASSEDNPIHTEFSDLTKEIPEPGPSGLFQDNRQMAEKDPNSEYHSCASPEDNPIHTEFSDLTKESPKPGPSGLFQDNRQMADRDSNSEYHSCASSEDNPIHTEFSDLTKESPEPGPSELLQDNRQMAENVPNSEYPSCASSEDNSIHTEFSDLTKESPEPGPSGFFQDNRQMAENDPNSEYHSCASSEDNPIHTESSKFQEDASQPGPVMVSAWTQTARENYSDSEYSSSASKITPDEEDEIYQLQHGGLCLGSSEMPQPQDSEQEDTSSPLPYVTVPFHPTCKTCMPSIHVTKEEKLMNIYYMRVQMKRGVAVSWDNSEKGVGPPLKKTKMEEMTCPEETHTGVTQSYAPTRELLTESESNLEIEAQEKSEEADEVEIPALEESSRAKTPDWLVALDSGFRCMGCCRVFPSLEVLQEHVQHGINEGFSCQAFHLALALLKKKSKIEGKKKREKRKMTKRTPGSSQEGSLGIRTSSCKEIIFQSLKGRK
ncbi:uncharacterized protein LOC143668864 isoform X1 [Tamandua tetradactyla]|uniref:uncharacterized protein LOC143668864 isoform X1 n=1 Tax=Tamandua tetradactyla TaxID=48850 RepID=UPI004054576C